MQKRIMGIDVARALAVFGMVIVNFKMVFGNLGNVWLNDFLNVLNGKAASTFVVLAGVGIALMSKKSVKKNNKEDIIKTKTKLLKRALFLFIAGTSYSIIWPADILHFYGVYMLLAIMLLKSSQKVLFFISLGLIVIYPILMMIWNYDIGWDYTKMEYLNFWTAKGFVRNLFFNGFHPVIPWSAFMIIGMWFGRMQLNNDTVVKKALWISLAVFVIVQTTSYFSILFLSQGNPIIINELKQILGTNPMPPLPLYMISGSSISIFIISLCILISKKFKKNKMILILKDTGQFALTFYIAHVVLGMGIIGAINPKKMGDYTINFSLVSAILFIMMCVFFSIYLKKRRMQGPIEWIMRRLTS